MYTTTKIIRIVGKHQIIGVKGDIFSNEECEVTALFEYVGLAALPGMMKNFLHSFEMSGDRVELKECGNLPPNVKAIYYAPALSPNHSIIHAGTLINSALTLFSKKGYTSVAMNGIRTWSSESDNLRIITQWFLNNPDSPILKLMLVDYRGGFNKLY